MKQLFLLFLAFLIEMLCSSSYCQVSISADNLPPDNSAILDIQSVTKGVLVPRMTLSQRNSISSPANGLFIFCTDDSQYYFNQGTPVSPTWHALNWQWTNVANGIANTTGSVGINTTSPSEKFHVLNGNIKIEGTGAPSLIIQQNMSGSGYSGSFLNPKFFFGRIIQGGDLDPECRIIYQDGPPLYSEYTVMEFDRKGIVASVKPPLPVAQQRGSHFEGFYSGASKPYFRLNSYPRMRLEMGEGGNTYDVDVAMERFSRNKLGFYTSNTCQVVIDSAGQMGIGTLTPHTKLEVNGMIYSTSLGFKFPDGTVQTTAYLGGKSSLDSGAILTSPNGKKWKISVNDSGEIKVSPVSL